MTDVLTLTAVLIAIGTFAAGVKYLLNRRK